MGHHEDHQDHQDYRDRQGSGGTRPRLRGKRGRRSSQASKLSTEDSFATSGGKPKSNAHALRALSRELQSSYQARGATGWKQWAMPPSEYGDRTAINSSMDTRGSTDMDAPRGTDEAPGYHSEDKAFESDAVSYNGAFSRSRGFRILGYWDRQKTHSEVPVLKPNTTEYRPTSPSRRYLYRIRMNTDELNNVTSAWLMHVHVITITCHTCSYGSSSYSDIKGFFGPSPKSTIAAEGYPRSYQVYA